MANAHLLSSFAIVSTVGNRILSLLLVVIGVAVITFTISHLIPGDPARMIAGDHASAATIAHVRGELGLDKSLPEQFVIYVEKLMAGDLGASLRTSRPVAADIARFLPATMELGISALVLAILVGIPLGVVSAVYRNGPIDQAARFVSVIGISAPVFWFGLGLLLLFYVKFPILPGGGRIGMDVTPPSYFTGFFLLDSLLSGNIPAFLSSARHLILPAFVLAFANIGIISRQIRAAMLDVLQEDYIRTAKANGLSRRVVLLRHALPNALVPSVTLLGLAFGDLLYGAVLTETIFSWPGMGTYVVSSIQSLDFPAIMGFTVVASIGYVLINVVVDLIYIFLDPQIRDARQ